MPRLSRKFSNSQIYHVMLRGNEKKYLFYDEDDKERLLDTLKVKKENGEYLLYAFCLMDNHVHLVVKDCDNNLPSIMKRINTSYAYYFNKKYKRVGHVFQDRYRSEVIEDEAYLLSVIKYVHNNPVEARMVEHAAQYKWSSFNIYTGASANSGLVEIAQILELYSLTRETAIQLFIKHTNEEVEDTKVLDINDDVDIEENEKIRKYLDRYLYLNNIESIDYVIKRKDDRNKIIRELKGTGLSVRKIASILGLNRNIVQRIR
jgi:putative transposase